MSFVERLQLDIVVVVTTFTEELIVRAGFADAAFFDEVAVWSFGELQPMSSQSAYIWSAFWIVDSLWAMAMVVLPLAARSSASCTTFSELESRADVAWKTYEGRYDRCLLRDIPRRGEELSGSGEGHEQ